jgi:hypothetical protein
MKFLMERFRKLFRELAGMRKGYRDLLLAWLNGIAAHIFPTPAKVRVKASPRPPARPRR